MKIHIEKTDERKTLEFTGTVAELLKKLSLNPETVLVVRENDVLHETDALSDDDEIRVLSVVSGG